MQETSFTSLGLIEPIERSLLSEQYSHPTPIQKSAIPFLLEGKDLLGCAQTGTGKTAAFALPILQRIYLAKKRANKKRALSLVLTPTRELAVQIADSFKRYGRHLKLKHAVIYGGVGHVPQIRAVSQGVDILVATPGRLLDLLNQKHIRLDAVEMMVLDEADRMLDMGFIRDVQKIMRLMPKERQTILFSATMPKEVAHLADEILVEPEKIEVAAVSSTAELIEDHVMFVDRDNKRELLVELLKSDEVKRTIVFTKTKHRANRLAQQISKSGIRAEAIHGNKSQGARQRALKEFSSGKVKVLVATDIVSRGIDVDGITHVINYELPNEPESYVHRIGRTARAGAAGIALSFCDHEESGYLADIEKLLKRKVNVLSDHAHHSADVEQLHANAAEKKRNPSRRRGRPSGQRRRNGRRRTGVPRGRRSSGTK